jgi:hypothetical protein
MAGSTYSTGPCGPRHAKEHCDASEESEEDHEEEGSQENREEGQEEIAPPGCAAEENCTNAAQKAKD